MNYTKLLYRVLFRKYAGHPRGTLAPKKLKNKITGHPCGTVPPHALRKSKIEFVSESSILEAR
jgi:prolyl-tRNA editing enzyme YbaK/EbsC (Cys-tRNA(Pro) deacylase)